MNLLFMRGYLSRVDDWLIFSPLALYKKSFDGATAGVGHPVSKWYSSKRGYAPASFADAEVGEDAAEDFLAVNLAGDFIQSVD